MKVPSWLYAIILVLPFVFCIMHYAIYGHELSYIFNPKNIQMKLKVRSWIVLSSLLGGICALIGGLLAAYIAKSEDWKKWNSIGALLRFWGGVGGFYALFLTGTFFYVT